MEKKIKNRSIPALFFLQGMFVGIVVFVCLYGTKTLNPFYDDWIFSDSDMGCAYFGWLFYRHSPNGILGTITRLTYPHELSIIFTDLVTPIAMFFKTIQRVLPNTFQYFGFVGILNYALLGGFSALLIGKWSRDILYRNTICVIVCLSPYMLQRMFAHMSLTSQWMIIAAFVIWAYKKELGNLKYISWILLCAFATITHLYLLLMVGIVMFFELFSDCIISRRLWKMIVTIGSALMLSIFEIYLLGGFSSQMVEADAEWGYLHFAEYNCNLNTLFDSQNYSRFLPSLTHFDFQYEGFGYLGLGVLLLILIDIILIFVYRRSKKLSVDSGCFLGMCIFAFLLAVGPNVSLGDKMLFKIPIHEILRPSFATFRSIGRFIWIVDYAIIFWAGISLSELLETRKVRCNCIIVLIAMFQFIDFSAVIQQKYQYFNTVVEWNSVMNDEKWKELAGSHTYICATSTSLTDFPSDFNRSMTLYAYENDMALTSSYFAHMGKQLQEEAEKHYQNVITGDVDEQAIYWFATEDEMNNAKRHLHCEIIDGFYIGWVE